MFKPNKLESITTTPFTSPISKHIIQSTNKNQNTYAQKAIIRADLIARYRTVTYKTSIQISTHIFTRTMTIIKQALIHICNIFKKNVINISGVLPLLGVPFKNVHNFVIYI